MRLLVTLVLIGAILAGCGVIQPTGSGPALERFSDVRARPSG